MKHLIRLITVLTLLLMNSCADRVDQRWGAFPLSEETDFAQMADQIKKNPAAWAEAAAFLDRPDLAKLPLGRHDLASGVYANIQEYRTKETSHYERHEAFVDVQVVLSGLEQIMIAPREALTGREGAYDPQKDIEFFADAAECRSARADSMHWVVLFPSDGHMPCMTLGEPSDIRKIVVKIPYIK